MKKAGVARRKSFVLFLCAVIGFFVSSCGLEVVYSIQEPTVTHNDPLYSSSDPLTWYFSFTTAPASDVDGLSYTGTDVYYKIYNNKSSLDSQKSAILSVNTETNGNAAATRLIETYSYQQLGTSTGTDNAVFFEGHDNRRVVLRLKNYQNGIEGSSSDMRTRYSLAACVGYYENADSTEFTYESYIPYRCSGVGARSFDFFDYDDDDKNGTRDIEPVEGDIDYYHSTTFSEESRYYVQLFAIARAWDTSSVAPVYSLVLDLGSVPIGERE